MTDDLYDIEAFRYGLMLILAAWKSIEILIWLFNHLSVT